ncbi:hypothetical protein GCK72_020582 [Caenorhabditis remanei]|uniref:Uncharacterized protein n=1 Tax=Caenorhabditis remanei TaxID=31234 RepID=A0A6A5GGX7_CAERE|nr:hypothetical protein GCK72_020582 [Caenorhabditis remanei]KAF1754024.1 hypothetical protein GCK72_020582 [Caenorhabditis remanei]
MPADCEPDVLISGTLVVLKFSPLFSLPFFIFAGYVLAYKSSKHLQPSKRAYGYFLICKYLSLLFLSSGIAPIIHTHAWGFHATGFLRLFDLLNPMWSIIITMYGHLVMLFFLVQVINTRCEAIEKLAVVAFEEEKKMFFLIRCLLKVLYFFILFSFWCLLLTLGFGEGDVQRRLRGAVEKTTVKINCSSFFFLDTESWRLVISIISIVFLLVIFLIFSIGYLSGVYSILKKSKAKISKKFWKIQTGFLSLLGIQVVLLFCFLLFLPICFLALKTPGSESTSLTILLFIAHHGTISTIIFIVAHRFVRSRILRTYNNCVPKSRRIGIIVDADRLDIHSTPQVQVFTVIVENTSV